MKKFTVAEDSMPFNYFDEVGFSFEDIAIKCIKKKYLHLSYSECENIFVSNYDLFSEKMCELRYSDAINDYFIGEEEIDESSGTWGYFHYEIDNIKKVKNKLEEEAWILLEEIVAEIKI